MEFAMTSLGQSRRRRIRGSHRREVRMRGRKSALRVVLTPEEHNQLLKSLRCHSTSLGLARRCRAILEVAEGTPIVAVARLVGLTEKHVRKWVQRFLQSRLV